MSSSHDAAVKIFSECLGLRTRLLSRVLSRKFEEALRPVGITGPQLTLLVAVEICQPVRPSEIARILELEKSTLSRTLQRMEGLGWITLRESPDDARGQLVSITAGGRRMLEKALPAWERVQEALAEAMGRGAKGRIEALYTSASATYF